MQTPNSFAAWKQVTPIHNALIDKIIGAPLHVLVSMRAKTEWILDRDDRTGRTVPRKVGLAPVMRDGIEYEFDVCGDMDQENTLQITKSRCPKLAGGVFPKPGKELADVLKEWLGKEETAGENHGPAPSNEAPVAPITPHKTGLVNGTGGVHSMSAISAELASIWKRMCSPRGVVKELDDLKTALEEIAGSTGVAEYARILRQHGVSRAKGFRTTPPARLCAKEVFALIEEMRAKNHDNGTSSLEVDRREVNATEPVHATETR